MTQELLKFGVIGDPISQSLSPEMFNPAFQAAGLNAIYSRYHVSPQDLSDFLKKIRRHEIEGVNVTIPHKQAVVPYLDVLTEAAKAIGAVNTIFWQNEKLTGDNTDGEGFWLGLENQKNKTINAVVLIGAGGAARAIGYTLLQKGTREITLVNRDQRKAENLATEWQKLFSSAQIDVLDWNKFLKINSWNISCLINATSLGLENQNPWPSLDFLHSLPQEALVIDVVAKPLDTTLLKKAHALKLHTHPGWPMLLYQAGLAFRAFTQKTADINVMQKHLLNALSP